MRVELAIIGKQPQLEKQIGDRLVFYFEDKIFPNGLKCPLKENAAKMLPVVKRSPGKSKIGGVVNEK